ncbi:MAG: YbjN domain-containing protein [Bacteroidia bacterium]|jgi:hypothetical protein
MQLKEISQLVETSIAGLKLDVSTSRGAKDGQWSLKIKDASVWIDAFDFPNNPGRFYLQVMSPLCAVPDKKADEFAWDLLEINYNLYGCAMCKKEGWLYVLSLREAAGLDQSEVDAIIDRVSFYSTDYYSKLSFKYQGCWLPKPPASGKAPGSPQ